MHEIWNICMKQEINKFEWNSAHYETRNICFMQYMSRNSLIVLREEILCNFRRYVFRWFKWQDNNKFRDIYFFNLRWAANMLHARYLWNIFHATCFIDVCPALHSMLCCASSNKNILELSEYHLFVATHEHFIGQWFLNADPVQTAALNYFQYLDVEHCGLKLQKLIKPKGGYRQVM